MDPVVIPAFIFALGVIVFVHELGHYLVAKFFGVRVITFSLGFGQRIWGFEHGGTEYRVAMLPLGGYVRMGGELPDEA
ncbi:MAG: site-2 protease family protein, partial [Acidobacteriota bacterium]